MFKSLDGAGGGREAEAHECVRADYGGAAGVG